jgi:Methyltransferase domain
MENYPDHGSSLPNLSFFEALKLARSAFENGANISAFLNSEFSNILSADQIIELTYHLQTGTYISGSSAKNSPHSAYVAEVASIIQRLKGENEVLLDVGTGELTTLAPILDRCAVTFQHVFACDLSWSRLKAGLNHFYSGRRTGAHAAPNCLVTDMVSLPFSDQSIDLIISSHSLEPNRARMDEILRELFRVSAGTLLLFEPCYEIASEEGRDRMDRLGYIKGLAASISSFDVELVDVIPLSNSTNPLNPTACYVINSRGVNSPAGGLSLPGFTVPGTNFHLETRDGFLVSRETGVAFPCLEGIPILREGHAILTGKYLES